MAGHLGLRLDDDVGVCVDRRRRRDADAREERTRLHVWLAPERELLDVLVGRLDQLRIEYARLLGEWGQSWAGLAFLLLEEVQP